MRDSSTTAVYIVMLTVVATLRVVWRCAPLFIVVALLCWLIPVPTHTSTTVAAPVPVKK